MGTVTIAATYGAGGSVVGPALAKRLQLPFIERAIPVAIAEKINAPLEAALADEGAPTSRVGRLLDRVLIGSGLFVGVPPAPDEIGVASDIGKTEKILRELADTTGGVILGRAGVFVLKGRPGVLHVRLDGEVEARRLAAAKRFEIDLATATRQQQQTDRARAAYVQHYYPRAGDWNDARHYHVVLNSTVISLDACVEIIVEAAHDIFSNPSPAHERLG